MKLVSAAQYFHCCRTSENRSVMLTAVEPHYNYGLEFSVFIHKFSILFLFVSESNFC